MVYQLIIWTVVLFAASWLLPEKWGQALRRGIGLALRGLFAALRKVIQFLFRFLVKLLRPAMDKPAGDGGK